MLDRLKKQMCMCILSPSVMSNCLQPHGLQPARFLCTWDSPGKNTGVGCHALLKGDHPNPGIKPRSPASQADSLPPEPPQRNNCVTLKTQ